MFKSGVISVLLLILSSGFILANFSSATSARPPNAESTPITLRACQTPTPKEPARTPEQSAAKPETVAKSVQILLDVDADLLIENSDGKRLGLDFQSKQFVNEIPEARAISRETSTTYVLPFDRSAKPYKITVSGKSASNVNADLSMTGPGFVVGFRGLGLVSGQVRKLSMASNGLHLSFTADQNEPTPQLFLTSQSGRGKPSYRFEVTSSSLEAGKTVTVDLNTDQGRLYFKTDDVKKDSFTVKMRMTNPGGTRDVFAHQDISFSKTNSYAMDFGQWDGKSDVCFYLAGDSGDAEKKQCTKLTNDSSKQ